MTDLDRSTTDPGTPRPDASPPGATQDTDTTAVPVPTSAIQPPPATSTARPSRVRWIAAGVLIALVIGITGLATMVLTSSQTSSVVLGYVPTDSVAYGELRLDLPGDQRQAVGEFLSKFPGFADQAALESKLDEVLDRLISQGTDGKQTFTKDIKPWFGGQLGFAVGPIPTSTQGESTHDARALILLSIKDATLAKAWFTSTMQQAGLTATTETYNGAELSVFTDTKVVDEQAAFTIVDGKVALAGDIASVKAAVDTQGRSAFAKSDEVTTAQAALAGDDIGFLFVDVKALFDATTEMVGSAASVPPLADTISVVLPDWTAMRVRVEGDALRLDAVSQHKTEMPGPDQNRANGVAGFAPPSTVALVAGNDLGATLKEWIALYRDDPSLKDTFTQLDQAAGMLGGIDALLGWMGDTGVVIVPSGESVEGGLVSIPADAAAAKQLLTTIRSFLAFGGAQGGITVTDEQYNGQTITVVDLGDLSGLMGMAGALGGGALPTPPSGTPDTNVQLAYVATDEVIAIGSSADFIKQVLDAGAGASLADEARYTGLLGRVDAEHSGVTFLDVAAIRGLIESKMATASAAEKAEYEESIKPFLVPLDALMSTATVGGSTDQTHTIITVK